MRIARFQLKDRIPRTGLVEGAGVVELEGDPFGRFAATDRIFPLEKISFLPPCEPSKIIALGTNFREHAAEMGKPEPSEPKIFFKPPSALLAHGETIRLPMDVGPVEYEAELAIVIGRAGRHFRGREALSAIAGFTPFHDVTARQLQRLDGLFARAKGFDTFAPVGPWIETSARWEDLVVEGWLNGQRRQCGALCDLIFDVPRVVEFVSRIMTLQPGDLISLGTPQGVGALTPGDRFEVRVAGVGTLSNPVAVEVPASE